MASAYPGAVKTFPPLVDGAGGDEMKVDNINPVYEEVTAIENELGTNPKGSAASVKARLDKSQSGGGYAQWSDVSTLTIGAGSITPIYNRHKVDTEGGAASDDLDTITAPGNGWFMTLSIVSDARNVVLRHNVGNIVCPSGKNITLDTTDQEALLIYDSGLAKWKVVTVANCALLNGDNSLSGTNTFSGITYLGGQTNGVKVDGSGELTLLGTATVWDDLPPNAVSIGTGASAPNYSAYNGNFYAYEFLGAATLKQIQAQFQMSHRYKEASDIYPHLHLYVPNDGSGGVIKFYLEYAWVNVDGTQPASTTVSGTLTIGAGAGNLHKILSFGALSGAGKTISSVLSCRFYRNPTDGVNTFGSSVWLKAADVHFEADTLGSKSEYTK